MGTSAHPAPTVLWQAEITVPKPAAALFEPAFETAVSVSIDLVGDASTRLRAVYAEPPERSVIEATLAIAAAAAAIPAPALDLAPLESRDWVAEGLKHLDAVDVGRVRVRGAHVTTAARPGQIDLTVDAGTAFGTGHHATTAGCLAAIQALLRRQNVRSALDMGCGTGVLAMALARLGVPRVLAADIDPVAAAVTRENARANRIGNALRTVVADSYDAATLRRAAPFDLVVANILARPLVAMAPRLARVLVPGGHAILSGLLVSQQNLVLNAHQSCGLILVDRKIREEWATLTLIKPGQRQRPAGPDSPWGG
jgi:ribosomal protein L11 methyltransferase